MLGIRENKEIRELRELGERLLRAEDIAEYLQVSIKTLRNWCYREKIPYVKVNGCVRFKLKEIETWINTTNNATA